MTPTLPLSRVVVRGCTFRSNVGHDRGGAIFVERLAQARIESNSVFRDNVAMKGKSVYAMPGGKVRFTECLDAGGGVPALTFPDCKLRGPSEGPVPFMLNVSCNSSKHGGREIDKLLQPCCDFLHCPKPTPGQKKKRHWMYAVIGSVSLVVLVFLLWPLLYRQRKKHRRYDSYNDTPLDGMCDEFIDGTLWDETAEVGERATEGEGGTERKSEGWFGRQRKQKKKLPAWQLRYKDLMYGNKIGSGAFGMVFAGQHLGTAVAIKEMALQSSREHQPAEFQHELDAAKTEIKILWCASHVFYSHMYSHLYSPVCCIFHRELRHPNILCFYGGCFDSKVGRERICLVTELCKGTFNSSQRAVQSVSEMSLSVCLSTAYPSRQARCTSISCSARQNPTRARTRTTQRRVCIAPVSPCRRGLEAEQMR
jgi:hypothetical protein